MGGVHAACVCLRASGFTGSFHNFWKKTKNVRYLAPVWTFLSFKRTLFSHPIGCVLFSSQTTRRRPEIMTRYATKMGRRLPLQPLFIVSGL